MDTTPAEHDTSPKDIAPALADHGLALERASKWYVSPGAPPSFYVLQEHECFLVLHISSWTDLLRSFSPEDQQRGAENGSAKSSSAFRKMYPGVCVLEIDGGVPIGPL